MGLSLERIRGGWRNVPENLKTKTMLSQLGLKPGNEAVAEVWAGKQWCKLYDVSDAVEKRKLTDKQKTAASESLEKARAKLVDDRTCSHCLNERTKKEIRQQADGKKICTYCIEYLHEEEVREQRIRRGLSAFRRRFETDFVILDTESTDLDGEIVEIGVIDRFGKTLLHSLVKPVMPVPDDSPATLIHGIRNSDLENAPTWAELREEVLRILQGKLVLAFNAEFDGKMVSNSCRRNKVPLISGLEWDCVMEAYRLRCGSDRWISLANASGRHTSHRAVDDCVSTLHVIKEQWVEMGLADIALQSS
ncbi:3'-5' exonuclease [Paenibacillus sp. LHD-117]|uniref:3'-5' exonuclease n=1 Tax=Paenibacillus sp. LHD-117 TaxID=3071412 RepID=UPI0027E193DD|nr:3'-5' exonuclease [Paenibacillus sp. LHD-117]MDQ6422616.1 3'-5' exonuclease [Paenibacillus sp. LHD-117]